LNELSLKLVTEQKWVDSFSPNKRTPLIQYRDVFTRLLLDDGRIDRFDRKGLGEIGLEEDDCLDVERHVLSIEAPRLLGVDVSEKAHPALHAVLGNGHPSRQMVDAALEELDRLQRVGATEAIAGRGVPPPGSRSRLILYALGVAVLALGWKNWGMPSLLGDIPQQNPQFQLREGSWSGSVRQLGLPILSYGFELKIADVTATEFSGSLKWYGASVAETRVVGTHDGNRLVFTEMAVLDGDVGMGETSLGTEKEVWLSDSRMVGTDDGGWSNLLAHGSMNSLCGDGLIGADEECDDGNSWGGDLCSSSCSHNFAVLPGGALQKGFTESAIAGREYALSPSRKPDSVLEDIARWATPATLVQFGGFRIMKTEVSWGAVRDFVRSEDDGLLADVQMSASSREWYRSNIKVARQQLIGRVGGSTPDDAPADATLREAIAVCAYMGGTLPTEEQWEYAARGEGGRRIFPWGDRVPRASPGDCDLMTGYFHASLDPPIDFNCGGRQVVEVGSLPAGCTPSGVCELAGNESELVLPGVVLWKPVAGDD
jgi:cysteine-rich repeat protein